MQNMVGSCQIHACRDWLCLFCFCFSFRFFDGFPLVRKHKTQLTPMMWAEFNAILLVAVLFCSETHVHLLPLKGMVRSFQRYGGYCAYIRQTHASQWAHQNMLAHWCRFLRRLSMAWPWRGIFRFSAARTNSEKGKELRLQSYCSMGLSKLHPCRPQAVVPCALQRLCACLWLYCYTSSWCWQCLIHVNWEQHESQATFHTVSIFATAFVSETIIRGGQGRRQVGDKW